MCIICIDLAKGTLKAAEARRALGEMHTSLDKAHVKELEAKLEEAESAIPKP
ncbi:MAG: hypothetical protein H0T79_24575 [Deltaproteobacteria bacterium]|nr:hypothetical protein [Deltaproteobacteria bacterium]